MKTKTFEEIAIAHGACHCIKAYKDRGLIDPSCEVHDLEIVANEYADQFKPKWISVEEFLSTYQRPRFVNVRKTTKPHVIGLYFDSDKQFRYDRQFHTADVTHVCELPEDSINE